jgi:hypothetical protein
MFKAADLWANQKVGLFFFWGVTQYQSVPSGRSFETDW